MRTTISNRMIASIECHRERMHVRNVISTYRRVPTTARSASNASANATITASGWTAASVNRITVYSWSAAHWVHFHFCSVQTWRWQQFAIHFMCFGCSASMCWCQTIAAKCTISMSEFWMRWATANEFENFIFPIFPILVLLCALSDPFMRAWWRYAES